MREQKWYQIEFYIGLYDLEELGEPYSFKEVVDKITNLIGDCTISPGVGSYTHSWGLRLNMNSVRVVKFLENSPEEFAKENALKMKKIFNQESIITSITECYKIDFNAEKTS